MSTTVLDEVDVRRIAREELARPAVVHQRNVEAVVGLPRRAYLRASKAQHFPTAKVDRLILARTDDVLAFFESRLRLASAPAANDADAEAVALARVGARRIAK